MELFGYELKKKKDEGNAQSFVPPSNDGSVIEIGSEQGMGGFAATGGVIGQYIDMEGGIKNEVLSPLIFPLNLSEKEVNQVVEFLKTLTGSNVDTLISDAHAAPIGDVSLEDPNWFHDNKLKY